MAPSPADISLIDLLVVGLANAIGCILGELVARHLDQHQETTWS